MQPLLGLDLTELHDILGPDSPAYRARQLYEAIYRLRLRDLSQATALPSAIRRRVASDFAAGWPERQSRYQSSDGTRRYLLTLADGRSVEAVFMPEQSRDTLCISSQIGCAVDCRFCLTAAMGFERNLTAGEIAGQVLAVAEDNELWTDQKRINVVMMGQGEPFLNLPNVLKAIRLLCDPGGLNISPRRITVSTSGITPRFAEFAAAEPRPKLAISLNASNEEQRRALMPITRKYSLAGLLDACRAYPLRPWERLTFEYVLLSGVNDSEADARRLARMLSQLRAKVNLIALNPGPGIPFESPGPERVARFQAIVRRSLPCFVRRSRGLDIFAACGQLKRMETGSAPLVELRPSLGASQH
ncbi:MAG TPA: 23S rRNA (adenine(2503)-C(2))-methyltransferase RlmN [Bryobacteraceae bacterium]|nr:23S rRNA (adenine(2503)-C(2))-methyltransferase RlmN [Bryobacteraceae bacterium]HPT27162.1 23S rRNA (adenine(2503)-C(2))-methyltransferase RlmN [Bryobacteraceae bacterium]